MAKVYYKGPGITTIGVDFKEGSYELSDKASKYVLETFPDNFSLADVAPVEVKEVAPVEVEEVAPKPKRTKK